MPSHSKSKQKKDKKEKPEDPLLKLAKTQNFTVNLENDLQIFGGKLPYLSQGAGGNEEEEKKVAMAIFKRISTDKHEEEKVQGTSDSETSDSESEKGKGKKDKKNMKTMKKQQAKEAKKKEKALSELEKLEMKKWEYDEDKEDDEKDKDGEKKKKKKGKDSKRSKKEPRTKKMVIEELTFIDSLLDENLLGEEFVTGEFLEKDKGVKRDENKSADSEMLKDDVVASTDSEVLKKEEESAFKKRKKAIVSILKKRKKKRGKKKHSDSESDSLESSEEESESESDNEDKDLFGEELGEGKSKKKKGAKGAVGGVGVEGGSLATIATQLMRMMEESAAGLKRVAFKDIHVGDVYLLVSSPSQRLSAHVLSSSMSLPKSANSQSSSSSGEFTSPLTGVVGLRCKDGTVGCLCRVIGLSGKDAPGSPERVFVSGRNNERGLSVCEWVGAEDLRAFALPIDASVGAADENSDMSIPPLTRAGDPSTDGASAFMTRSIQLLLAEHALNQRIAKGIVVAVLANSPRTKPFRCGEICDEATLYAFLRHNFSGVVFIDLSRTLHQIVGRKTLCGDSMRAMEVGDSSKKQRERNLFVQPATDEESIMALTRRVGWWMADEITSGCVAGKVLQTISSEGREFAVARKAEITAAKKLYGSLPNEQVNAAAELVDGWGDGCLSFLLRCLLTILRSPAAISEAITTTETAELKGIIPKGDTWKDDTLEEDSSLSSSASSSMSSSTKIDDKNQSENSHERQRLIPIPSFSTSIVSKGKGMKEGGVFTSGTHLLKNMVVMESRHPLKDKVNVSEELRVTGASGLKIKFDRRCSTEQGKDKLRFINVSDGKELKVLHGTEGFQSFVIADVDRVLFKFESSGGSDEWGYKFFVTDAEGEGGIGSGEAVEESGGAGKPLRWKRFVSELGEGCGMNEEGDDEGSDADESNDKHKGSLELAIWIIQLLLSLPLRGCEKPRESSACSSSSSSAAEAMDGVWIDLAPLISPLMSVVTVMNGKHPLYKVFALLLNHLLLRWCECRAGSVVSEDEIDNQKAEQVRAPCLSLKGFPTRQIEEFISEVGMEEEEDDDDDSDSSDSDSEEDDDEGSKRDVDLSLPHAVTLLELKAVMIRAYKVRKLILKLRSSEEEKVLKESEVTKGLMGVEEKPTAAIEGAMSVEAPAESEAPLSLQNYGGNLGRLTGTGRVRDEEYEPLDTTALFSPSSNIGLFQRLEEYMSFFLNTRGVQPDLVWEGVLDAAKRIRAESEHPYSQNGWKMKVVFPGAKKITASFDQSTKVDKSRGHCVVVSSTGFGMSEKGKHSEGPFELKVNGSEIYLRLETHNREPKSSERNYGVKGWVTAKFPEKAERSFGRTLIPCMRRIHGIFADRHLWNIELDSCIVDLVNRAVRRLKVSWEEIGMKDVIEEAMEVFQTGSQSVNTGFSATDTRKQEKDKRTGRSASPGPLSLSPPPASADSEKRRSQSPPPGRSVSPPPFARGLASVSPAPSAFGFYGSGTSPAPASPSPIPVSAKSFPSFKTRTVDPSLVLTQLTSHNPSTTPYAHLNLDTCTKVEQDLTPQSFEAFAFESSASSTSSSLSDGLESSAKEGESDELIRDPLCIHPLSVRLSLLFNLNNVVSEIFETLPLASLSSSLQFMGMLKSFRSLLFVAIKEKIWEERLNACYSSKSAPHIRVNRTLRGASAKGGTIIKNSLFVQVMEALRSHIAAGTIGSRDYAFRVDFIGEGSTDAGGPYRECLSDMASELQQVQESSTGSDGESGRKKGGRGMIDMSNVKGGTSCKLPLLRPSANRAGDVGTDRECFVMNVSNDEDEWSKGTENKVEKMLGGDKKKKKGKGKKGEEDKTTAIGGSGGRVVRESDLDSEAMPLRKVEMLRFLGSLMGIHIVTRNPMNVMLGKTVWKHIADEQPTLNDLESVDEMFVRLMRSVKRCTNPKEFAYYGLEWNVLSTDGKTTIDLSQHKPLRAHSSPQVGGSSGGAFEEVAFEDREAYCAAAEAYRLREGAAEAAEIRRGLLAVVPEEILMLATGKELEFLTCGDGRVTVEDLKKITVMSGFDSTPQLVRYFWDALSELSNLQRQLYLRFVTGRSRLPPIVEGHIPRGLEIKVTIMGYSSSRSNVDGTMPESHTCSQHLELPRYSSKDILKERLIYAITNCVSIDTDFTASGGYEVDADEEMD
ncbi:putative HECT E3 ubiquitin ligase [Monocercomonoides exilis]|uniref:putative HECT E3 ubiquitin ligase n=1 Tax=Monocercomonoides exilis TaxID=2049356 RepID=UPI00355A490F|nr:putative HECT E3 ubiquitin ligase [Monocercomonoides exilis]|eukprot:MONOS_3464.1-p1 / transcript=MONOS_3464.1 / gene=MONOS_3464 / organism=Monocercomonoides_exilis_PA203 / gene_product=HECT E3 ubiquitin ligase, putative / transcript_product=HECT E3 ubiquitin ligase, putative / location=Mono_scaffold00082:26465-32962(+) / protein_length=2165 / sequence_SO=supercontig / SO=protein_coding / is_pseudo=false